MHKQLLILVRILVLHYIFFTICYSQQDTLNNNRRKEVQARIDLINQLIKEKGYKWKAGFNSLSYYDDYQLAKLCGEKSEASKVELNLIKQDSMYLDYISQSNKLLQILSVPNWKSLMITPELQDTGCKNCWAYASTGVAEGLLHNYLGYNADLNLNEDSLTTYGCDGCDGGAASCGLALIKNRGIPSKVGINSGWYYDNARYKIASYSVQAPTNINSIKTALTNSPVYASMYVYWDFYYVVNDPEYIYQHTWGDYVGSHAVVIVGYNDDEEYWLCKNSWGTGWGNQGYFKIAYGECGIDIINCGTATVNQSNLAKIIPTVIPGLSTALSYSFGSGEYAYVIGYNSLTSNPNPIPYNGVLLVKNGATINLNNFQLLVSGNMYNQWGQIIIENGGNILHSAKLKKNGLDRIIGYFPYTFTNDYTVSTGYEMTVNSGSLIKFYTNKKLIVQGSLISIGTSSNTITFTRDGASGNWGGIQFNSGSSGTLDFCNITYATTGINMYNSSPTIKHSTIDNNSSVGVYCDYYSSPILVGNNIRNNSSYGLRCNSYSSPNLTDYGYPGSNVIRNNLNGVYTSYNCNPSLNGYLTYGNSVFNNTNQEVVAYYNSIVNANKVYWGTTFPPLDAEFYASSSTINRNDPLQTNPNPNRNIIPTNNDNQTPIHATMSIQFDELELAEQKQREGKHDEAINLFLEVFKKETNTDRGRYALIKIEECFTQAKKKDFLNFSKKELKPLLKEENELFVVLLELETHQLYNLGFGDEAMNNLKMILYKYNLNEAIEKQTLYRIGAYYLDLYNDKLNAQKTFDDLASKYPDDELLTFANLMLNEDRYNTQRAKNIDQQMIVVEETKEVLNNYPNPFNPTTTITFTLLTKENIKLKIFDVLGREVAILADGEFEMGKHEITVDASKLPSGVYFYNLTTNGNSLTKKMLLIK